MKTLRKCHTSSTKTGEIPLLAFVVVFIIFQVENVRIGETTTLEELFRGGD